MWVRFQTHLAQCICISTSERISFDASPRALQPVVNRDGSMTKIHLEHVDNHEITVSTWGSCLERKLANIQTILIHFLSVLVPASNLGIHIQYNIPFPETILNSCPQENEMQTSITSWPLRLIDSIVYENKTTVETAHLSPFISTKRYRFPRGYILHGSPFLFAKLPATAPWPRSCYRSSRSPFVHRRSPHHCSHDTRHPQ